MTKNNQGADRPKTSGESKPPPPAKPGRHPAGPHAKPHLTDHGRTPGTGSLSDPQHDNEADVGSE